MFKVVFTFDVAPEKQGEYLKATADKIKPYWELHGCQSYQIWQVEGTNTFIKEMHFADQAAKDKTMSSKDAGADAVRKIWRSFVAGDFTTKMHIHKV